MGSAGPLKKGAYVGLLPTASRIGVVLNHLIYPLDWQQLRPGSRMARLTAAFAATALAPHRWLKPRAVAGGCLEELRNLRKIRYRRLASSLARALSWLAKNPGDLGVGAHQGQPFPSDQRPATLRWIRATVIRWADQEPM